MGPNDKENKLSRGIAGSDPYISPEMWENEEYDAIASDAWSAGNLKNAFMSRDSIIYNVH